VAAVVTSDTVKESLSPKPDGVTVDFNTSVAYKPGTVSVWQNGIRLIGSWDDGWTEQGGTIIRMLIAPLTGDTLQAEYEAE